MGGTLKIIGFQHSCCRKGRLALNLVSQTPIQPALNTFRDGATFCGQPVPVSHHSHSDEFLPFIQSKNLPSFSLKLLSIVLSLHVLPLQLSCRPLKALGACYKVSLDLSLPWLNNPNSLSLSSPDLWSSSWPCSGCPLTGPHYYICISRAGCSTPGGISQEQSENNLTQTAGHKSFDAVQGSSFSNAVVFSRGELIHVKLKGISSNKDVKAQEDGEQLGKSTLWELSFSNLTILGL